MDYIMILSDSIAVITFLWTAFQEYRFHKINNLNDVVDSIVLKKAVFK